MFLSPLSVLEGLSGDRRFPPIIIITAFGDEEMHEYVDRLGAVAMFDKPFKIRDLVAKALEVAPPAKTTLT